MAYGLKYFFEFENQDRNDLFRTEFHFKDYEGSASELQAAANPIVHKWNTDDPFAEIRGSSIEIRILNKLPFIQNFYTNDDDGVKVIFKQGTDILFTGFLVQDDFQEDIVEYLHELTLSATDNLGLLKDIDFDKSNITFGPQTIRPTQIQINTNSLPQLINISDTLTPLIGDTVIFTGTGTVLDGMVFTILNVFPAMLGTINQVLQVDQPSPVTGNFLTGVATYSTPQVLTDKIPLSRIIGICLNGTGLQLNSKVFLNILHESAFTHVLLETFVRGTDFKSGDSYKSCYDVLQEVLKTLNAVIYQQAGGWVIIRPIELFYGDPAFAEFNNIFELSGNYGTYSNQVSYGGDSVMASPVQSVIRPLKYAKETFNYNQISRLLINSDFTHVGTLIRSYTQGTGVDLVTIYEYQMPDWSSGFWWNVAGTTLGTNTTTFFIRVIKDYRNEEKERFAVITGNPGFDDSAAVVSQYIETNAGDKIDFSITLRTSNSIPGGYSRSIYLNNVSHLPLTPRAPWYELKANGVWEQSAAQKFQVVYNSGENANQWKSVSITSNEFPTDGRLYVYLPQISNNSGTYHETHIKGLSLTYIPLIAGQPAVKGHTHTNTQPATLKNKTELNITLDDAQSNAIVGTLFKPPVNQEIIRDRTRNWHRVGFVELKKLGEITTAERLFINRITRVKVEIDFKDIWKGEYIGPLNKIDWDRFPLLVFLFGNLEINYMENKAKATVYELNNSTETLADLISNYVFKYIYEQG